MGREFQRAFNYISRRLRPVNFWVAAAVVLGLALVVGLGYLILGRKGGNLVATNIFAGLIGLFFGATWPAFRRALIRARSPVEVGEYLAFAGQRFPLKVLDGPTAYQPQELVMQISGPLPLPDILVRAHDHMVERMKTYTGTHVLFDGSCFVITSPPLVRRSWESIRERPTIVVDLKQTTYFIRVLCRGAMAPELEQWITTDWPKNIPALKDLRREIVSQASGFSPFLHPGAGINVCLVAYDRIGRPWTLVQVRGQGIAEETGAWCSSIHESFSQDDTTPQGTVDPYHTATRGAREELGVSLTKIEFFVVGIDEGSLPGTQVKRSGGFELVGYAETSLPAERLEDTRFRGRDKFESAELLAIELSVESVLSILRKAPPDKWFPPALLALLETLERFRPGSWHLLAGELEDI